MKPDVDLPPDIEHATEAFGSQLRVAILRRLVRDGAQTPSALAVHLRVASRTTLLANLDALEHVGLLSTDVPPGQRRGRQVTYTVDKQRLSDLTHALALFLHPSSTRGQ